MKTKYAVRINGQIFTRNTDRTYTHAVAAWAKGNNRVSEYNGKTYWEYSSTGTELRLEIRNFCGSLRLATNSKARIQGLSTIAAITIVPVADSKGEIPSIDFPAPALV